jgi:O-antigen ligase
VAYSNEIRFKVEWPRAVRALVKNPLLGTGYSSVGLATDNDYLRALAETGFLGFGVFGWVVVEILRRSWVFWRKGELRWLRVWTLGLTMATIGLLINAFFIDVFEASKVAFTFWLLAGATMGAIDRVKRSA